MPMMVADNPGWQGPGPVSTSMILRTFRSVITHQGGWRARIHKLREAINHTVHRLMFTTHVLCPCCGWEGFSFLATSDARAFTKNSMCPRCGSRSRHRGLVTLFQKVLHDDCVQNPVLVFAPERVVLQELQQCIQSHAILTTDLCATDVDLPHEDIQCLTLKSDHYAAIICNHVLEHVENDIKAINECARILHPDGVAIFTIPGDYDQIHTVEYHEPRENGHWRHYGSDVVTRFKHAFADVQMIDLNHIAPKKHGVRALDMAFVCRKRAVFLQ